MAGPLVCGVIGGKRSYDLPGKGKQSNGTNLSACNEKSGAEIRAKRTFVTVRNVLALQVSQVMRLFRSHTAK